VFARFVLRRVLPVIGIAIVGFAAFVWYLTLQMQRGADDVLATIRSLHLGDEGLSKVLELDERYPREVFETFSDKGCIAGNRCFAFAFGNTWLRRLHLAPGKGIVGRIDVDANGRLWSFWIYGAEQAEYSGMALTGFSIHQTANSVGSQIDARLNGRNEMSIWISADCPEEQRGIALDLDLSFLSRLGQHVQSPAQFFRQDLRKLKE
jgi:hypothetical protein